ncbi:MAG: CoA transferase [Gammaproteobacteria bacterium]|nr:CoA transferase [Gammaproteobacteria bacterium]
MGALDHLRVLELGNNVMAPFCARLFADMGAEVIKVETPDGDPARARGPFDENGMSGFFQYLNAGKSSVTVDFDDQDGRRRFDELLTGADVFIENLPIAQRQDWNLTQEALVERFPHLVVVYLSAYGRSGPWKDREGTDITIQATSGLSARLGIMGDLPLRMPFDQAEYQASENGVAAALCALIERETSGLGQFIDISATRVLAYQAGAMALVSAKMGGQWVRAGKINKSGIYPSGFYECKDGFLAIALHHGRLWKQFIKIMGDPEWSQLENQQDAIYLGRAEPGTEPAHIHFRAWLMEHTRTELLELTKPTEIILGVVNHIDEVCASEQFAFRDFWSEVSLGDKEARFPKTGFLLSETPTTIKSGAPKQAEDIKSLADNLWEARQLNKSDAKRGDSLQGVRILDFGWNWAGPMAGQLLADMGAEVIRVETNKRLDNMRLDPYSWYFCHNNRSKMSTTFNLKDEEAIALVKELVRHSDVVMENFAAGVMAKNGLAFEDLKKINPKIVLMSMSMAGEEGPAKDMRGFASIATAYSSIEGMAGYPDRDEVVGFTSFGLGDTNMAMQGTIGSLAALIHARRTGEGQFVDVSQIESSTATLGEAIMKHRLTGDMIGIQGNYHSEYAPHNFFAAEGDNRWVAVSVTNDDEWRALCEVMGRNDLLDREDLQDQASRRQNVDELDTAVADWCRDKERDQIVESLAAAGVRAAPVLEADDWHTHPMYLETGHLFHHESPDYDDCDIYNTPWTMSATPPRVTRPTPTVGEQNDYVFKEILELEDAEIERLVDSKALY